MSHESARRTPYVRRALLLGAQGGVCALALLGAFALRFEFVLTPAAWDLLLRLLPLMLVTRIGAWWYVRLDRVYGAHVGMPDLLRLLTSSALGTVLTVPLLLLVGIPFASPLPVILALELLLVVGLTAAILTTFRLLHESAQPRAADAATQAFIIGAGNVGEQLLRQLQHDSRHRITVAGLLDDDPAKRDRALHGVPVLGTVGDIRRLAAVHGVSLAIVAIPSATATRLREIVAACRAAGVNVKLLPPLRDLMVADVRLNELREVRLEDLLGRAPIELDLAPVRNDLTGSVVLVTGGAGSIGAELVRQVAAFRPRTLIIIDRAESPLHAVHCAMLAAHPEIHVVSVLGSVTNAARLDRVFAQYRPEVVFHAAAYKQLPMLEQNAIEGLYNNVIGTLQVARCAARYGARRFVLISTDKAVNPTSVLGVTKLLAERVVLELPSLRAAATDFRVVRFGNVLGSDGSVVPLFARQLAAGGPLTVTHPEVRRYFMTIPESVQLVLAASTLAEAAGQVSLLEMGVQIRITELAEQMIHLAGRIPHEDVRIVYTGLRPGEKLEEELVGPGEVASPTSLDKIRLVTRSAIVSGDLALRLRQLTALAARGDEAAMVRALATAAPEYRPGAAHGWPRTPHANGNGHATTNGNGNGNGSNGTSHSGGSANGRPASRTKGRRIAPASPPPTDPVGA